MKEDQKSNSGIKIIITIAFMIFLIVLVTNSTKILKNSNELYIVANGSLSYEEPVEGYVIRDEVVLQGENYKNGMVQILSDGERASKGQAVFRYYSNNEGNILSKIAELDEQINELLEDSTINGLLVSDIASIENQMEDTINSMYNLNYLQKIQENKNKIEAYISRKAQITGFSSPSDSYVRILAEQRRALENDLAAGSEVIEAPNAGLASYRVDGLEEVLKTDNFDYLNSDLLESFDLKVGAVVPLSNERGKIVNNFECYIAVPIDTEKSMSVKVGDKVTLRFSNTSEVKAEISYIKEEDKQRILVFKISEEVAELLEYRKISFDIIWWKYTGWKVSNSALIEEDDGTYVERNKAGFTERILVKVLRQNDTYSIVENYEDDELRELVYSDEEISNMSKIKLYDEIVIY